MRPFLLGWNPTQLLQQDLLDYLDTRQEIKNYFVPFLGTVLLVADQDQAPTTLARMLHLRFGDLLFTVSPADSWATQGWMPRVFWNLVQEPKSSGRWSAPPGGTVNSLAELLKVLPQKKDG